MNFGIPAAFVIASVFLSPVSKAGDYDPLSVSEKGITSHTYSIKDEARKRELPIRVYFPNTEEPAPVILFSHGLGGSRDNNPYLGEHWAKRGYVVVFMQHPGSDESVWKGEQRLKRRAAMKGAASLGSFMDRMKDVPLVIDSLEKWNKDGEAELRGKIDLEKIGMSGHSFGAMTTQAVSGQAHRGGKPTFLDERIDASVMLSPSIPKVGDPAKAFGTIKIPCLLMTGTKDNSPIGDIVAKDRVKVFPNITNAPAWQIVFDGAEHMSFGEGETPLKQGENRYHKPILALTTAFWDANLRDDNAAKAWINGKAARSVMLPEDQWDKNKLAEELLR